MIRPHRFVALAAAIVATVPLAAQQPAFTLEQALSAPFPDDLVAAATGGAVAWVFNTNGARNIWVAAPPEYQGRPVTAYADDERPGDRRPRLDARRESDRVHPRRERQR